MPLRRLCPGTIRRFALVLALALVLAAASVRAAPDGRAPEGTGDVGLVDGWVAGGVPSDGERYAAAGTAPPYLLNSHSLLQQATLAFVHTGPQQPAPGEVRLGTALTWVSLWAFTNRRLLLDGEMTAVTALGEVGLASGLSARLVLSGMYLTGGQADQQINNYHSATRLDDLGRADLGNGRLRFLTARLDEPANVLLSDEDEGWYPRAPVMSLRWGVWRPDDGQPVTVELAVNAPHYERRLRFVEPHGHPDWALAVSGGVGPTRGVSATASLAYVRTRGQDVGLDGRFLQRQYSLMLAGAYQGWPRLGLRAQALIDTPLAEGTDTVLDRYNAEGLFGVQYATEAGPVVEVGLWEDLTRHNNTGDVGLHVGVQSPLR